MVISGLDSRRPNSAPGFMKVVAAHITWLTKLLCPKWGHSCSYSKSALEAVSHPRTVQPCIFYYEALRSTEISWGPYMRHSHSWIGIRMPRKVFFLCFSFLHFLFFRRLCVCLCTNYLPNLPRQLRAQSIMRISTCRATGALLPFNTPVGIILHTHNRIGNWNCVSSSMVLMGVVPNFHIWTGRIHS